MSLHDRTLTYASGEAAPIPLSWRSLVQSPNLQSRHSDNPPPLPGKKEGAGTLGRRPISPIEACGENGDWVAGSHAKPSTEFVTSCLEDLKLVYS